MIEFAYRLGIVASFLPGDGHQILYAEDPHVLGLLTLDGQTVWQTPVGVGTPDHSIQGIGDLDGDGALDVISVGHCNDVAAEIKAYEGNPPGSAAQVRWTLALPNCGAGRRPSHVSTGDLDGDGRDEAVFTKDGTLFVIGENDAGDGKLLWAATLVVGTWTDPIIAATRNDGRPVVIVSSGVGRLYAFGE